LYHHPFIPNTFVAKFPHFKEEGGLCSCPGAAFFFQKSKPISRGKLEKMKAYNVWKKFMA